MSYEPFVGELDKPDATGGFQVFNGELDKPQAYNPAKDSQAASVAFEQAKQQPIPDNKFAKAATLQAEADKIDRPWVSLNEPSVASDTALGLAQGAIRFAQLPGTVYGLATGNVDNAYNRFFNAGAEAGDELKSNKVKAEGQALSAKIDAADGWREKLAVGGIETLKNGTLFADQLTQQAAGFLGGAGAGAVAEKVLMPLAGRLVAAAGTTGSGAVTEAAVLAGKAAQGAQTGGAVGANALIQGQDITADTFKQAMAVPISEYENEPRFIELIKTMTPGDAKLKVAEEMAAAAGRMATLASGAASLIVPGGAVTEGALARGAVGKTGGKAFGTVKAGVGETVSEGSEEYLGSVAKDTQLQRVIPDIDIAGNAAAAFGQGAAVGGPMGASIHATQSFADPNGPASQAGITPIAIPVPAGAPNVSTPSNTPSVSTGAGNVASPVNQTGVADPRYITPDGSGVGNVAGGVELGSQGGQPVSQPASEPSASVKPITQTSDADLLARIPSDEKVPATIWTGRSGAGYDTVESAQQAMESRLRKDPELDWKVEQRPDGKYHLAGYATQTESDIAGSRPLDGQGVGASTAAAGIATASGTQGVANETVSLARQQDAIAIGDGVRNDAGLGSQGDPANVRGRENIGDAQAASDLGSRVGRTIEIVTPETMRGIPANSPRARAYRVFNRFAGIANTAFGYSPVAITGLQQYGVQFKGRSYIDIDEMSDGKGEGIAGMVLHTMGHEVGHSMQKSTDPEDRAAYQGLRDTVIKYAKSGVIDRRQRFEDSAAMADGLKAPGKDYAIDEVVNDVNGAMWRDSKFWGMLYDLDGGSTMRKIAYKFMQTATKIIGAAKKNGYNDIDTLVGENIEIVREAAAKAWADRAMRKGKDFKGRTALKADLFDTDPSMSRKGVIGEVAPNPDQAVAKEWDSMDSTEKTQASRDVGRKVAQGLMDILGLKGWDLTLSSGTYEGKTNPNFIINAPDSATQAQVDEFARLAGYVLDQKAMVTFDENNTEGENLSGFVKVVLPQGMPESKIKELRAKIGEVAKYAGDDTLRDGALVFGNFRGEDGKPFSGIEDAEFRSQILDAVAQFEYEGGAFEIPPIQRYASALIWPDSRDGYLEGTRYGKDNRTTTESGGEVLKRQGSDLAQLRKLSDEAIGRRQQWIDNSASGKQRAAERRSARTDQKVDGAEREYGTAREGAVSRVGVHFSQQRRANLSSQYHGTGLKGAERDRMNLPGAIKDRLYFYVDNGNGVHPEAGVGGVKHSIKLNNLYDINKDQYGYMKLAKNADPLVFANGWERMIKAAGFDGWTADNGGNQAFAVLLGKHDIEMPSFKRKEVDDFNGIGNIDDLGSFNLDRDYAESTKDDFSFPDLSEAEAKLDAAKLSDAEKAARLQAEREDAKKFKQLLERELVDAGFGVSGVPKMASTSEKNFGEVKPAEIKAQGLMAEEAYPDLDYTTDPVDRAVERAYFVIDGTRYKATISERGSPKIQEGATEKFAKKDAKGFMSGYELTGFTSEAKKAWNKRFAASADLLRRGFDIYTSVPAKARENVLSVWKSISANNGAFEFNRADGAKGSTVKEVAQSIADKMMEGGRYKVKIGSPDYHRGTNDFSIMITDTKTGAKGSADVEFWQKEREVTMHTHELDKGSGMGKPVYQIGQAFADKFNSRINADGILLGVNNYRRTEQMFSGMLRSGNYDTMQPGIGQRIYGWNERAKNQEQQDRNMVRTALAMARNVLEFAPKMKDLGFDLSNNQFYFRNKPDNSENRLMASVEVKRILSDSDARVASISRSTLARAAITLEAIDGKVDVPETIAEPVLYSRKQLDEYLENRRKTMPLASPQSTQDSDIDNAVKAIKIAVKEIDSGNRDVLPVPIGRVPHVLTMLRMTPKMLRVDTSILRKVFSGKHAEEFDGITPEALVRAIYQPAMVLKGDDGSMEIVTSLITKGGPVFVPVVPSAKTLTGGDSAAISSIYGRKVSLGGNSILQRIKDGKLLYADAALAQIAITGRNGGSVTPIGVNAREAQFSDARPIEVQDSTVNDPKNSVKPINPYYSGWSSARDIILDGISQKKVKSDLDLVKWIGNQYKPENSPDGWDDAPSFKRKQAAPRAPGMKDESWFMEKRRQLQDQFIQIREVQDMLTSRGGVVGEAQDVYRAEERMHGRAQELLNDFAQNQIQPFIEKAAKAGVSLDEIALYAYAKHAKERNDYIASINPNIGDAGSGMSNDHADNIIQLVDQAGDKAKFDDLHNDLMGITSTTRRVLLDEGLITPEEYKGWEDLYENYVPLRGFEDVDHEAGTPLRGTGRGFSMTGKESVKALGRTSKAGDILENIIRDYERAVIRSEKNSVAKTFLDLATSNPDPDLWEVQPVKINRSFNKASGMVLMTKTPDTGDETIAIKVGGQQVRVKINDPLVLRAMKLAAKDETSQLERILANTLGTYTNLMRNTLTRFNPIFGAINAVRDSQMGLVSAYDALGGEGAKLYLKYLAPALSASFRKERGKADPANKEMDRWIMEMRFAGGTTGGYHMRDTSEITDAMRTMMLQAGASPNGKLETIKATSAYKGAQAAMHWLEIIGATSEDAARAAAYRAARETGKTPAEAASIAKNLTTNFNRKGEWGTTLNSLYLFFNAGVQGSTRVLEALGNRKVQYMMAGVTAAAMTIALLNAGAGDDDDGQNYWDKIPDFEKERNLIFMLPPGVEMDGANKVGTRGRYIKIPLPYGINVFPALGNGLADMARYAKDPTRGKSPAKAGINLASAIFGSINPFGGSLDPTKPAELGLAIAPTAADLGIQFMAGVNSFGRPVGPEKSPFDDKPDSENFSAKQAGTASQHVARWLNSVTGGNEGRSGAIDIMPGTIDNVVRNTTGGLGVFLADTFINLPSKVMSPVEVTNRDVPLLRNFYGQIDEVTDQGLFYDRRAEVTKEAKAAEREMKLGLPVEFDDESRTKQALAKVAESYTKWMTALRKEEIEIAADETLSRGEKMLQRRRVELERNEATKAFNQQYNEDMRALKSR